VTARKRLGVQTTQDRGHPESPFTVGPTRGSYAARLTRQVPRSSWGGVDSSLSPPDGTTCRREARKGQRGLQAPADAFLRLMRHILQVARLTASQYGLLRRRDSTIHIDRRTR